MWLLRQLLNIWSLCGSLITSKEKCFGYYEQNRKGSWTPLDIPLSNRNQSLRQKSLIIGCGGGFQQECGQPFSPVAEWMSNVELFLEDEGQQYGNMEEAASVARTPACCLEVWSGDHRQTPGGLKKNKESKAFRKKLTHRPLALRGQTQYTQAHDLGGIAQRYLDCPERAFPWKLRQLLEDGTTGLDPAVVQVWQELIGEFPPRLDSEVHRAAFAILWMGLRGEREGLPSMLATTFAGAAGVDGRQRWGLVLSSSARVSHVTYQTVVGVRYSELVTFNRSGWNFGKFVTQEKPQRGGTHAVEDIGAVVEWLTERCSFKADAKSSLAVLHNRNDMTTVPATGPLNRKIPLFPEGSLLAPAWLPTRLSLPKPESGSSLEVAKSHSLICRKMNKLSNWRRRMPEPLWQSPELGHCVSSWDPLIWKASLALLLRWVRSCMALGMCGPDVPISIYMIKTSVSPHRMKHSWICLPKTVACLDRAFLRRLLLKSFRTMLPTFTKFGGCISSWWTCGGRGITTLPGQKRSQTNYGMFGIVIILVEWVHSDPVALNLH